MSHLHTSPLGAELDAAREEATADVVDVARGRRRRVRATRLPGTQRERAFRRAVAEMFTDWDMEAGDG